MNHTQNKTTNESLTCGKDGHFNYHNLSKKVRTGRYGQLFLIQ